jgi:hypothetical protein
MLILVSMRGTSAIQTERHNLSAKKLPTPSACTICTATSSSGSRIRGTTITRARRRTVRHGSKLAYQVAVSSAVAPGITVQITSDRRAAQGPPLSCATGMSASGWPGHYPLVHKFADDTGDRNMISGESRLGSRSLEWVRGPSIDLCRSRFSTLVRPDRYVAWRGAIHG